MKTPIVPYGAHCTTNSERSQPFV